MYEECKKNNVKLDFREEKVGFTIIFYRKSYNNDLINDNQELPRNYPETTQIRLTETQEKIIQIITKNKYITRKDIAEEVKLTQDGVKYNLEVLKKKKIIKRVGNDRGGYWEVIDNKYS